LPKAKQDPNQLKILQDWLLSYKPSELFTEDGDIIEAIANNIPKKDSMKLGQRREAYAAYQPLKVPDWCKHAVDKGVQKSCMEKVGEFVDQAFVDNPKSLRVFSPDELASNKLEAMLRHTNRNFQWDELSNARGGRVIETLSEHTCQGFLQGYTLTGRTGIFPSYESFLGIISTMMVQYSKFKKMVSIPNSSCMPYG
jgi:xylulose-5-phosphate/fructose-6-phosphate phosphoketolase